MLGVAKVLKLTIPQLAEHLIATHLSRLTAPVSCDTCSKASTFVIAPPNTPVASNINDVLQTRLITRLETVRIQLLDTVQIMPYFDIVGLSESFSEVTSRLLDMHNMTDDEPSHRKRHILLIDGLCPALDSTQRRSGLVQVNALAASFLRSVTNLSRSHSHILIVVNLGATWDSRGVRELTSAFSGVGKCFSGVSPGGLLQTTLLAGIDTVILLHDMVGAGLKDGDLIVEVVKDRTDACLGHWTVWPRSG